MKDETKRLAETPNQLEDFLNDIIERSCFEIEPVRFDRQQEWGTCGSFLSHRSGAFLI